MEFKNEEKSEFANAIYKLGKVAILRFAELLEKEGVTENTGKTIENASAVIRNFEKAGFDCTEEKFALSEVEVSVGYGDLSEEQSELYKANEVLLHNLLDKINNA